MTKNDVTNDATRVGNRRHCACTCGAYTNHPRSIYLPGHDARHVGQVAKDVFARRTNDIPSVYGSYALELLKGLPSVALKAKAARMADAMLAKANVPVKQRVVVTATQPVGDSIIPILVGTCKVGRWEYQAEMVRGSQSLRYKSKQGVWMGSTKATVVKSFVAK